MKNTNCLIDTSKTLQFGSTWAKLYAVLTNRICRNIHVHTTVTPSHGHFETRKRERTHTVGCKSMSPVGRVLIETCQQNKSL